MSDESIFNMDKASLFTKDTTQYAFHKKMDDCTVGIKSKERIIIAFCSRTTAEKCRPLVIWKSGKKTRWFLKTNLQCVSATYQINCKAWNGVMCLKFGIQRSI
jgi:hypothetical protein